jgi:hypothetical protein
MNDSSTGNTGNKPPYITTLTPNQLRLLAIIVSRLKQEEAAA